MSLYALFPAEWKRFIYEQFRQTTFVFEQVVLFFSEQDKTSSFLKRHLAYTILQNRTIVYFSWKVEPIHEVVLPSYIISWFG